MCFTRIILATIQEKDNKGARIGAGKPTRGLFVAIQVKNIDGILYIKKPRLHSYPPY